MADISTLIDLTADTKPPLLNRAAMIFKVGDLPTALDRQYATIKEGMPVSLIMERDWGKTLEEICPPNKVFSIVEVNPDYESFYMDMLKPLNPESVFDARLYRARKCIVPLTKIAEKVNDSTLIDKLRSPDFVPMVDGRSLVPTDFLDALLFTTAINIVEDKNVITSGSYDIGSGETYTTISAFEGDIGSLTGDITGTLTSSVTETSTANFSVTHNGYTLTITSDSEAYGYPGAGNIVSVNHTGSAFYLQSLDVGTIVLEKFYAKAIGSSTSTDFIVLISAGPVITHDCMFDANGTRTGVGIHSYSSASVLSIWNVLTWDFGGNGYRANNVHADSVIENCTAYSCGIGFTPRNLPQTMRNCLSLESTTADYNTLTNVTFDKNGSSDATGSTGLINLTSANMVNSLDDTSEEFLNITPGSTIDGAGTTTILSDNTQGIRKNARPNSNSLVSCGATESMPSSDIITLRGGFKSRLLGGFQ